MFGWIKNRNNHSTLPDWLKTYLSLDFKIETSKAFDQASFVVLDCETTGLGKSDSVVTVGAVWCTSRDIFLDGLLDIKFSVDKVGTSSEIHGELSSKIKHQGESHLEELIKFLSNRIIVGHNIHFDIRKIDQLLRSTYHTSLKNKVLDTASLMKRLDSAQFERTVGGHANLSLDTLCEQFNIKIENRHTALGDSFMTAQLFQKLLSRLKGRGLLKVKELLSNH